MLKRLSFIIGCLFIFVIFNMQSVLEAQETQTLELVIALDTSGSMSTSITSDDAGERNAIDAGNNLLFFPSPNRSTVTETTATDPDDLRFITTEAILSWLASYAEYNDDIDIRVSVIGFDSTVTPILPMISLGAGQADSGIILDRPTNDDGNSDFIALYDEVNDIFSAGDSNSDAAFILVTDSPPCNPDGEPTSASGVRVRNEFCDNESGVLAPHLREATTLPSRVQEYVFYINPTGRSTGDNRYSIDEYWDAYDAVRSAWDDRVGSFFFDLEFVEELPAFMQQSIMREVGFALGDFNVEDVPNITLSASQYRSLGLIYSDDNDLSVPPFQSRMDFLLLPSDPETELDFSVEGDTINLEYLISSNQAPIRVARRDQPASGDWSLEADDGSLEVWAVPTPADVIVSLMPEQPRLYQAQRLVYQFIDNGNVLSVADITPPTFDLTIESPSGESIDLGSLVINDTEDGFESAAFLPIETGRYDIDLDVSVGQGSLWAADVSYDFLTAPNTNLIVAAVAFELAYLVNGVEASNLVQLPRSLPLSMELTANSDGEQIDLPEGLVALINLDTSDDVDNSCLSITDDPMEIATDNRSASYELDFDDSGQCQVDIDLSLSSPLPPLNNSSVEIDSSGLGRNVTVDDTQLLSVSVLTEANENIEDNAVDATDFSLDFPFTSTFTPDSTSIIVEIRDANNQAIWPVFAEDATSADVEVCGTSERIVPFALRITNGTGRDVAQDNEICLRPTDVTGQYRAEIAGLNPGTYTVVVLVNRNTPELDTLQFEYNPQQFPTAETELSGILEVTVPLPLWAMLAGAILAVLTVLLIVGRFSNRGQKRLRGSVALFAVSEEDYHLFEQGEHLDKVLAPVWSEAWPRSIEHKYQAYKFLSSEYVSDLNIEYLKGTTDGNAQLSKRRSAKIELSMSTREQGSVDKINGEEVRSKESRYVGTVKNTRIYLVQDAPDSLLIQEILQKSHDGLV